MFEMQQLQDNSVSGGGLGLKIESLRCQIHGTWNIPDDGSSPSPWQQKHGHGLITKWCDSCLLKACTVAYEVFEQ